MLRPRHECAVQNDLEVLAGWLEAAVSMIAAHIEQNPVDEQNQTYSTWTVGERYGPGQIRLDTVRRKPGLAGDVADENDQTSVGHANARCSVRRMNSGQASRFLYDRPESDVGLIGKPSTARRTAA